MINLLKSNIEAPQYTGLFNVTDNFEKLANDKLLLICVIPFSYMFYKALLYYFLLVIALIFALPRTFSIVFPKTLLFINLKKSFSNAFLAYLRRLVFFSMYGFK